MKFSVGDLVVEKTDIKAHTSYNTQKVVGIFEGALLLEHHGFAFDGEIHPEEYESEVGSRSWRESLRRFQEEELFTPDEAVEELHRLEAAKSKLAEEFDAVRDQLHAKLQQAAALVKEAGELAKAHDKEFYDLRAECMPLYKALESGGWSHSHMRC